MHRLIDTYTHNGSMLMGMTHREGENDDSREGSAGATISKDHRMGSRAQIGWLWLGAGTLHCTGGET